MSPWCSVDLTDVFYKNSVFIVADTDAEAYFCTRIQYLSITPSNSLIKQLWSYLHYNHTSFGKKNKQKTGPRVKYELGLYLE